MRELFHHELDQLGDELAGLACVVGTTMEKASRALSTTDLALAEQVLTTQAEIHQRGQRCEEHACALLALQSPVAKDLRAVVTAIRAAEKIARMGDLASHIAQVVRLRHPRPVLPVELRERCDQMSQLALRACRSIEQAIAAPTELSLPSVRQLDHDLDRLHREVLREVTQAHPPYPVQTGVDAALLARYFERFGDQAVSVTGYLDYILTGQLARH